ncbi:histone H2A.Z-specific chaperone CHZ1 [Cucumis melo]|uniref:Histone H2A.Z-specific chaperone CHZ1 n=1 Tax=Cucumis melo TaxID=3656 RepID=A0ABM3L864_CUCME|nr:histone H2A.Z-specific chaperone CHZ1 [Cucumis melo]
MAEITNRKEEVAFDAKRKPADSCFQPKEESSNKIQKLEVVEGEESCNYVKNNAENGDHKGSDEQIDNVSSTVLEGKDDDGVDGASLDAGDEEEDYEDEDDSEDDEKSSGKVAADRKGKGIMKDDKGKGKLIEEDDDDDDEDSSDDGSDLDSEESDLSDDPLAEVDLDNILPSRTRRRMVHPGVYFATDLANDDDDSSDSDA